MPLDNWQERRYREVFEEVCRFVEYQQLTNPDFTIEQLEQLLEKACIREGNDWVGRGMVSHIADSATIAAYEHMLVEWRNELASGHEN
jgi:hypothetical protein